MFPRLTKVSGDLLTDCTKPIRPAKARVAGGTMIFFGGALFGLVHTASFDAVA